jgi:hypothetical protein
LNSPPPSFFISPLPHSWTASADTIFPFTYICTQYLHHIHPPPFPNLLHHPTGTNSPRQDMFQPPVDWFCVRKEEKNDIFGYLRELHRVLPCGISTFICIIAWFGLSPLFFFFYLSHFLTMFSTYLKILNSFLYRQYINHFYLFNFLLLPSPSHMWLPSVWSIFHRIAIFILVYIPNTRENMRLLAFWTWLTALKMIFSSSIHFPAKDKISFFFVAE